MLRIEIASVDKLQEAMKTFQGEVEPTINEVLHNQGGELIAESVRRLIPESGKTWRGKAPAAKSGKSLQNVNENLAVIVKNSKRYGYLYFPNDGSNTRRHVGNQQFFEKGGEAVQDEIIERCITALKNKFEEGV